MKKILCLILIILFFICNFCSSVFAEANIDNSEVSYGTIYMQGEFLDGDILRISISSKDMTQPVLGIAFNLLYDAENISFLKYEPGEFLERGGDPFYLVRDNDFGEIIFGETLRRDNTFPIGSGVIANFYFQILNEAEFNFEFKKGVISTLDIVRQDLNQISWENLSLNRENNDFIAFSSTGENNIFQNNNFWIDKLVPISLVLLSLIAFKFIVNFIKNRENKRP